MNKELLNKIVKLENHTFKGNTGWIVETDARDHWQPYKVITRTGKEIQRLQVMTCSEFFEWRETLEAQPILNYLPGAFE